MAVAAGWPPNVSREVAAVATAESDRRRCACSYCCCGLLQIHLSAHGVSKTDMCDPIKNLRKGLEIYRGSGNSFASDWFANWDQTARDKYNGVMGKKGPILLPGGDLPEKGALDSALDKINPIDDVAGAISAIGKFIARLFEPEFWVRVGKGVLGAAAVGFGVVILSKAILGFDIPGAVGSRGRSVGRGRGSGGGGALMDADTRDAGADEAGYEAGRRAEIKREARERGKVEQRERSNKEWRKNLEQKGDKPPF